MGDNLYGFGFSYVHRRALGLLFPYPNVDFAEDAPFMFKLREKLGAETVGLKDDDRGLCMHIVHGKNSTTDLDLSCEVADEKVRRLEVADMLVSLGYLASHYDDLEP